MKVKVLITYATKHGATAEIAERNSEIFGIEKPSPIGLQ